MFPLLILMLSLLSSSIPAKCSKILLLPLDHPGHMNVFIISGKALSAMGHDVHVLTMEKHRKKVEEAGLEAISLTPSPDALSVTDDPETGELLKSEIGQNIIRIPQFLQLFRKLSGQVTKQCEEILQNKEIKQQISDLQFDISLVDGLPPGRCLFTILYRHGLRYVSLNDVSFDAWKARVSSMPSVEPLQMTSFTNEMSFFQRLTNLLVFVLVSVTVDYTAPDHLVERYVPDKPKISLSQLHRKSELFMSTVEIYLMDYPRISAPHYLYVGSMGGNIPKPLKPELEKFVSSAEEGVILVSFGSIVQQMPDKFIEKMIFVFKHFSRRKFLMRCSKKAAIPDNAKLMDWLPQNDLLGHKSVKLFITHGGNNGQMEALYHGVPMIVCPLFGDQPYNAARIVNRKFGQAIDIKNDTPEKMIEIIQEVLENPVYAENIKKASEIYKALPKANETVAYWVDHVLRFGSDHLRPSYIDMPLYQLFMLDILVFIVVIILVTLFLLYKCCHCCYRRTCRETLKKSKKE